MVMTKVTPKQTISSLSTLSAEKEKKSQPQQPRVKGFREVLRRRERIQDRKELPETLLKKFIAAINKACPEFDIGDKRSKVEVKAHYMATTPDPVLKRSALILKYMEVQKVSMDEALSKFIDPRKEGYAFVLLTNGQGFYYHVETGELYRKD